jgi:hypothetical protein
VLRIDHPLSFVTSRTAIPLKGAVNKALDFKDAIYLTDSLLINLQPLIGELRVLEEYLTVLGY